MTRALLACLAMTIALLGCDSAPQSSDPPRGAMVYVDMKTHTPVVQLATNEVPAVHPETGEKTLMPALYCPECQRWHPTPPFDTLQHAPGAALCPTDRTPLTADGPWPEGDES